MSLLVVDCVSSGFVCCSSLAIQQSRATLFGEAAPVTDPSIHAKASYYAQYAHHFALFSDLWYLSWSIFLDGIELDLEGQDIGPVYDLCSFSVSNGHPFTSKLLTPADLNVTVHT